MLTIIKKNIKGFTLVELLVGISIIVLISSVFLANYRAGASASRLNMAAHKLASDIRLMQGYAIGLKDYNGNPTGGWGVFATSLSLPFFELNNNIYRLFAETNINKICDNACRPSFTAEIYKEVILPDGIIISQVTGDAAVEAYVNIMFEPPDPRVHINESNPAIEDYSIGEIILTDGTNNKTILVNKFGLIDINN